ASGLGLGLYGPGDLALDLAVPAERVEVLGGEAVEAVLAEHGARGAAGDALAPRAAEPARVVEHGGGGAHVLGALGREARYDAAQLGREVHVRLGGGLLEADDLGAELEGLQAEGRAVETGELGDEVADGVDLTAHLRRGLGDLTGEEVEPVGGRVEAGGEEE